MKEGTKLLFTGMLILFFVLSLLPEAFHLPISFIYLFTILFVGSLSLVLACPFLNFLTIKCNFLTYLLMGSIILTGILYIMKMFMIDFAINEFTFTGLKLGNFEIKEFEVSPIISIVIVAMLTSFLSALYKELDRKQ